MENTIVDQLEVANEKLDALVVDNDQKDATISNLEADKESLKENLDAANKVADEALQVADNMKEANLAWQGEVADLKERTATLETRLGEAEASLKFPAYKDATEGADSLDENGSNGSADLLAEYKRLRGTSGFAEFFKNNKSALMTAFMETK